jgi:hypothetical protein
MSELAQAQA